MKPHITWILIVDGERGRILQNEGPGKGLALLDGGHFHNLPPARDLRSDKPGRAFESGNAARHAYSPRMDLHRAEKLVLCKEMAKILNKASMNKKYERLVLVAPPQMLGDLRHCLEDHVKEKIIGEVTKDLTRMADHDIADHLGDVVAL